MVIDRQEFANAIKEALDQNIHISSDSEVDEEFMRMSLAHMILNDTMPSDIVEDTFNLLFEVFDQAIIEISTEVDHTSGIDENIINLEDWAARKALRRK